MMPNNEREDGNGTFSLAVGKFSLRIASHNLLTILIVLGLLGLLVGSAYIMVGFVRNVQAEHQMIRDEHGTLYQNWRESFEEMTYLMSLPESQRPLLNMPKSLRHRLYGADATTENK